MYLTVGRGETGSTPEFQSSVVKSRVGVVGGDEDQVRIGDSMYVDC